MSKVLTGDKYRNQCYVVRVKMALPWITAAALGWFLWLDNPRVPTHDVPLVSRHSVESLRRRAQESKGVLAMGVHHIDVGHLSSYID